MHPDINNGKKYRESLTRSMHKLKNNLVIFISRTYCVSDNIPWVESICYKVSSHYLYSYCPIKCPGLLGGN